MENHIGPVLASSFKYRSSKILLLFIIFVPINYYKVQFGNESFIFILRQIISCKMAKVLLRVFFYCWKNYEDLKKLFRISPSTCFKYTCNDIINFQNGFILCFLLTCWGLIFEDVLFTATSCALYCVVYLLKGLPDVDIEEISEENNLCTGYGIAYFYYHNYLTHILPEKLQQRIQSYKNDHNVSLQEKLFILVPNSCTIPDYIDVTYDRIQRARELPPQHIDVAGIKKRTYNITVYDISTRKGDKRVRCAVEYAQPLRHLKQFNMNKAWIAKERIKFCKYLENFLQDTPNTCCLLKYDDGAGSHDVVADLILKACDIDI